MKCSKYFLNELAPEDRAKGFGKMPSMVAFTDNDIIEGSHYFSAMVMGPRALSREHGPHTHKDPELLAAWVLTLTTRKNWVLRLSCI